MIRHASLLDLFVLAVIVGTLLLLRDLLAVYPARYVGSALLMAVCLLLLTYIIVVDEPGVHS